MQDTLTGQETHAVAMQEGQDAAGVAERAQAMAAAMDDPNYQATDDPEDQDPTRASWDEVCEEPPQPSGLPSAEEIAACPLASLTEDLEPTGPPQKGRGKPGQYVYWITQPALTPVGEAKGYVQPEAKTREEFALQIRASHHACDIVLEEVAVFDELHMNGTRHKNALVRSKKQYRWAAVGAHLAEVAKMRVDFADHIKSWADGVVYGLVASDHKPPAALDQTPFHWPPHSLPLKQAIPQKWQAEGFVRRNKMNGVQFYDCCNRHEITTEEELWAVAGSLSEKGDRGLLAYCMENDPTRALNEVRLT